MLITAGSYTSLSGGGLLEIDLLIKDEDGKDKTLQGIAVGVEFDEDGPQFALPFVCIDQEDPVWITFGGLGDLEEELHRRFEQIRATSINGRKTDDLDYNGTTLPSAS